jgi:enoyl-CoA hydratase
MPSTVTFAGDRGSHDSLEDDPQFRVGVLTGTPNFFCARTDLGDLWNAKTDRGGEYGLIRRRRAKPLIAAVEGVAFGGGLEMALACDIIVASESARFAFPEPLRGLVANSGGLFRAVRALPFHVARDLLLSGGEISGRRAYDLGLASRLATAGSAVEIAVQVAWDICRSSPGEHPRHTRGLEHRIRRRPQTRWAGP